jgi:hypothetical protein
MRARLALWQLNSNNGIWRGIGLMCCLPVSGLIAKLQSFISLSLAQDNEIQKPQKLFYFNGLRVSSLSFAGHS